MATINGFFTKIVKSPLDINSDLKSTTPNHALDAVPECSESGLDSGNKFCKDSSSNKSVISITPNSDQKVQEDCSNKRNLKRSASRTNKLSKRRCVEEIGSVDKEQNGDCKGNNEFTKSSAVEVSYTEYLKSLGSTCGEIKQSSDCDDSENKSTLYSSEKECESTKEKSHQSLQIVNNLNNFIQVDDNPALETSENPSVEHSPKSKCKKTRRSASDKSQKSINGLSSENVKINTENCEVSNNPVVETNNNPSVEHSPEPSRKKKKKTSRSLPDKPKKSVNVVTSEKVIPNSEKCEIQNDNVKEELCSVDDLSNDVSQESQPESVDIRSFFSSVNNNKSKSSGKCKSANNSSETQQAGNSCKTKTSKAVHVSDENSRDINSPEKLKVLSNKSEGLDSVTCTDSKVEDGSLKEEHKDETADLAVPPCKDIRNFFSKSKPSGPVNSSACRNMLTFKADIHGDIDCKASILNAKNQNQKLPLLSKKSKQKKSQSVITEDDLVIEVLDIEPEIKEASVSENDCVVTNESVDIENKEQDDQTEGDTNTKVVDIVENKAVKDSVLPLGEEKTDTSSKTQIENCSKKASGKKAEMKNCSTVSDKQPGLREKNYSGTFCNFDADCAILLELSPEASVKDLVEKNESLSDAVIIKKNLKTGNHKSLKKEDIVHVSNSVSAECVPEAVNVTEDEEKIVKTGNSELNSSLLDFSLGLKQASSVNKKKTLKKASPVENKKSSNRLLQKTLTGKTLNETPSPIDTKECAAEKEVNVIDLEDESTLIDGATKLADDDVEYLVTKSPASVNKSGQVELKLTFKRIFNGKGNSSTNAAKQVPENSKNLKMRSRPKRINLENSTEENKESSKCEIVKETNTETSAEENKSDEPTQQLPSGRASRRTAAIAAAAAINAINSKEASSRSKQKLSDSVISVESSETENSLDDADTENVFRDNKTKNKQKLKSVSDPDHKLAPLFMKRGAVEPLPPPPPPTAEELEKQRLRNNFLQSGVPEELRRQQSMQSASLPFSHPDWSLNIHVQQKQCSDVADYLDSAEVLEFCENVRFERKDLESSENVKIDEVIDDNVLAEKSREGKVMLERIGLDLDQEVVATLAENKNSEIEQKKPDQIVDSKDEEIIMKNKNNGEASCDNIQVEREIEKSTKNNSDESCDKEEVEKEIEGTAENSSEESSDEIIVDEQMEEQCERKFIACNSVDLWRKSIRRCRYLSRANIDCWNLPGAGLTLMTPHVLYDNAYKSNAMMKLGWLTLAASVENKKVKIKKDELIPISVESHQLLLTEILTSNPKFPAYEVFTQLSKRHHREDNEIRSAEGENKINGNETGRSNKNESVSICEEQEQDHTKRVRTDKRRRSSVSATDVNSESNASRRKSGRRKQKCEEEIKESTEESRECTVVETVEPGVTNALVKSDSLMWTEKYAPQCSNDVIGNRTVCKKLFNWLSAWKKQIDMETARINKPSSASNKDSREKVGVMPDSEDEFEKKYSDYSNHSNTGDYMCNTVLLLGPKSGIGKTSMVYAVAQEVGFKVFEVNSTQQRDGKRLLSQLHEATQSHQVARASAVGSSGVMNPFFKLEQTQQSEGAQSKPQPKSDGQVPPVKKGADAKKAFEKMFGMAKPSPAVSGNSKGTDSATTTSKKSNDSAKEQKNEKKSGKNKSIIEVVESSEEEVKVRKGRKLSLGRKANHVEESIDSESSRDEEITRRKNKSRRRALESDSDSVSTPVKSKSKTNLRDTDSPKQSKPKTSSSRSDSPSASKKDGSKNKKESKNKQQTCDTQVESKEDKQTKNPEQVKASENKETAVSLILFDEADVVLGDDRGFWSAVETFINETKRPIILTATDEHFPEMFRANCMTLKLHRPPAVNIASYLQILCLIEDKRVSHESLLSLVKSFDSDVRKSMLTVQFWLQSLTKNSSVQPVKYSASAFSTIQQKFLPENSNSSEKKMGNENLVLPQMTALKDSLMASILGNKLKENHAAINSNLENVDRLKVLKARDKGMLKEVPLASQSDIQLATIDSDEEFKTVNKNAKRRRLRRVLSDDNSIESSGNFVLNSEAGCEQRSDWLAECKQKSDWLNSDDSCSVMSTGFNQFSAAGSGMGSEQEKKPFKKSDLVIREDLLIPVYENIVTETFLSKPVSSCLLNEEREFVSILNYNHKKHSLHYSTGRRLYNDLALRLRRDRDCSIEMKEGVKFSNTIEECSTSEHKKTEVNSLKQEVVSLNADSDMNAEQKFKQDSGDKIQKTENITSHSFKRLSGLQNSLSLLDSCYSLNDWSPVVMAGTSNEMSAEEISAESSSRSLTEEIAESIAELTVKCEAVKNKELEQAVNTLQNTGNCSSFGRMADKNCSGVKQVVTGLLALPSTRSLALDYMPAVRDLCRAEDLRKVSNTKRRFLHYLNSCNFKSSTLETLTSAFS